MLQINPNEVIRIDKLINSSLDIIREDILYFKNKYDKTNRINELDIEEIEVLTEKISYSMTFLDDIINEVVEATGESLEKLLSLNHSLDYYEEKLISHYANKLDNKSNVDIIDLCYSKDGKLDNYCQKKNYIEYLKTFFNNFNPEEYGLDQETIINDLIYVYEKRGPTEAYAVMRALENNCPSNYHEYNFKPTQQLHSNSYYDYNKKTINNYQTNSEMIDINGCQYEIAQVLPKDCTKSEQLAYNFGKANIINTMRSLPNKYLDLCSKGNANVVTLVCNRKAMNNNANWSGYYKPSTLLSSSTNMITVDIHGSFTNNEFYTQDTLIHEMGHKFDDMMYGKNIIDWIFGRTTYTKSDSNWEKMYKKYNNVLSGINLGGYENYPNVNEFFGDATVAYFKNPDLLRSMCPEVYNMISNMLNGEPGYVYNQNLTRILNA